MGHLSKHPSVGRRDSLNCRIGAVHIPFLIHGNLSLPVSILGSNLSVLKETVNPFLRRHESSLAMGNRRYVGLSNLRALQPWGLIGNHFRIHHSGNMAVDGIKCQGRRILFLSGNISAGNQPHLKQCLETVADTKGQSVSFI